MRSAVRGVLAVQLHPDKTRLIEFGRYAAADREGLVNRKLSISWGSPISAAAAAGTSAQAEIPAGPRAAKLKEIKEELWRQMHWPIPEQGRWLAQVIRGFFNYHAVPTNFLATLGKFRHQITRIWLRTLRRRSQ